MNPEMERLALNIVAAGCLLIALLIALLVLHYGLADAYRDLGKHIKRHFSG